MNTYFDLLMIQWIVVFIIDISGAIDALKSTIARVISKGKFHSSNYCLKPLDCSLCMTFWSGLIYMLITSAFSFGHVAYLCFLSATTTVTLYIFNVLYDTTLYTLNKLEPNE